MIKDNKSLGIASIAVFFVWVFIVLSIIFAHSDAFAGSPGKSDKYDNIPAVEPNEAEKQQKLANALNGYNVMVKECRRFNGQMVNDRKCIVDISQVYTCRYVFEKYNGQCKVRQGSGSSNSGSCDTVIITDGGQGSGSWRKGEEWRAGSGRGRPHGTVPAPASIWLILFAGILYLFSRKP